MRRVRIGCHHRIPDRFDDRPTMAHGCLAQKVEVLLDQLEGIQVADTLIERRRPLMSVNRRAMSRIAKPCAPPTTSERNRLLNVWLVSRCLPVKYESKSSG